MHFNPCQSTASRLQRLRRLSGANRQTPCHSMVSELVGSAGWERLPNLLLFIEKLEIRNFCIKPECSKLIQFLKHSISQSKHTNKDLLVWYNPGFAFVPPAASYVFNPLLKPFSIFEEKLKEVSDKWRGFLYLRSVSPFAECLGMNSMHLPSALQTWLPPLPTEAMQQCNWASPEHEHRRLAWTAFLTEVEQVNC